MGAVVATVAVEQPREDHAVPDLGVGDAEHFKEVEGRRVIQFLYILALAHPAESLNEALADRLGGEVTVTLKHADPGGALTKAAKQVLVGGYLRGRAVSLVVEKAGDQQREELPLHADFGFPLLDCHGKFLVHGDG